MTRNTFALNLLAAILSLATPLNGAEAGKIFNVREFGAKGSRKVNDQRALQAAFDACAKAGGRTVVLPAGDYLSGTLQMASGVMLRLEAGATLWASTDPRDYPAGRSAHLLVADGAQNLALLGPGIINGQGTADYGARWGVPDQPAFRVGILLFNNCRQVIVRDVSILNSDAWTLHFKRCEDVVVEDATIRNNYRRLPGKQAGQLPVIDLQDCQKVAVTEQ